MMKMRPKRSKSKWIISEVVLNGRKQPDDLLNSREEKLIETIVCVDNACKRVLEKNHQIEAVHQQVSDVKSVLDETKVILDEMSELKTKTDRNGEAIESAQ
jgi:hypothetical protein